MSWFSEGQSIRGGGEGGEKDSTASNSTTYYDDWSSVDEVDTRQRRRYRERQERKEARLRGEGWLIHRVRLNIGETRYYLILGGMTPLWEHKFKSVNAEGKTKFDNHEPCRGRQGLMFNGKKMGPSCPICFRWPEDQKGANRPYYGGMYTALSLTPYHSKKGYEWCYNRYVLAARLGTPARPGMLKRIKALSNENGVSLHGCVLECHRTKKQCEVIGDRIKIVKKIQPDKLMDFLRPRLEKFVARVNQNIIDPKHRLTVEQVLQRDPIEPLDFHKIIVPRSNREVWDMIGRKGPGWERWQEEKRKAIARLRAEKGESSSGSAAEETQSPPEDDTAPMGSPPEQGNAKGNAQSARLDDQIPF